MEYVMLISDRGFVRIARSSILKVAAKAANVTSGVMDSMIDKEENLIDVGKLSLTLKAGAIIGDNRSDQSLFEDVKLLLKNYWIVPSKLASSVSSLAAVAEFS